MQTFLAIWQITHLLCVLMSSTQTGNTMQMERGEKSMFSVCCFMHLCCGRQCMKRILCLWKVQSWHFLTILMGNILRLFSRGFSLYPTVFAISDLSLYLLPCVSSCWRGLWTFSPYSSFWWTRFLSLLMTRLFHSAVARPCGWCIKLCTTLFFRASLLRFRALDHLLNLWNQDNNFNLDEEIAIFYK